MKNILKQIIAGTVIALLLLVGNVKASEIKTTSLEAIETNLQLENWMTDETVWTPFSLEFVQESDANLELENWMTCAESWNLNFNVSEEFEAELQIEDWMINDETWNTDNTNIEPELMVEPWMLNSNLW